MEADRYEDAESLHLALEAALRLRKLSSDPDLQSVLLRERGCLSTLSSLLHSSHATLVLPALQTLCFLTAHSSNRGAIASFEHGRILSRLADLAEPDDDSWGDLQASVASMAQSALSSLSAFVNGAAQQTVRSRGSQLVHLTFESTPSDECALRSVRLAALGVRGVVSVTVADGLVHVFASGSVDREALVDRAASVASVALALREERVASESAEVLEAEKAGAAEILEANVDNNAGGSRRVGSRKGGESFGGTFSMHKLVEHADSLEQVSLAGRLTRQAKEAQQREQKVSSVRSFLGKIGGLFW